MRTGLFDDIGALVQASASDSICRYRNHLLGLDIGKAACSVLLANDQAGSA